MVAVFGVVGFLAAEFTGAFLAPFDPFAPLAVLLAVVGVVGVVG